MSTPVQGAGAAIAWWMPGPRWSARVRQRFFRTAPADLDPFVLRHSRIYILPTPRGLAFIATLATMLVLSLNYALSLGFVITFVLSGMAGAALLHTWRNLAGLSLRPLAAGETFAGNPLPFTLAVSAGAVARSGIAFSAGEGTTANLDIGAGAQRPITLSRRSTQRGRLALGRVTLASVYPLGLWRAWAYVHFPLEGIVYPAPEINAPPLPPGMAGHDATLGTRASDTDLAGLRDYQPGDPMPRIAWKAVARGAGWYTKEFEGSGGGGPVDLAYHGLPTSLDVEARLSRLTAWVLVAERAARPFGVTLPASALPAGQGREHRRMALTALALCPGADL